MNKVEKDYNTFSRMCCHHFLGKCQPYDLFPIYKMDNKSHYNRPGCNSSYVKGPWNMLHIHMGKQEIATLLREYFIFSLEQNSSNNNFLLNLNTNNLIDQVPIPKVGTYRVHHST